MRANNVVVDDVPQHLAASSLYFLDIALRIPLEMEGVISFLTTRPPTDTELGSFTHGIPAQRILRLKRISWHIVETKRKKQPTKQRIRRSNNDTATVFGQISSTFVKEDFLQGLPRNLCNQNRTAS